MPDCRLLIDARGPGDWNMAVDETLLEWAARRGGWALRFYGWSEPTLSLGFFQAYEARFRHPSSRDCPAVRRSSGGGAIVHDDELTYSLVAPVQHPLAASRDSLYRTVHGALVAALASLGVAGTLAEAGARSREAAGRFLCFERRAAGDVLVRNVKVAGSAQRRRRGAILQHGSVLLRSSTRAPELPGVECLTGIPMDGGVLLAHWSQELGKSFGLGYLAGSLDREEAERAWRLAGEKYGRAEWRERR